MLKVEQKIHDFTEEELEIAYNEFGEFKETGVIDQSLIRDLYNEHRSETGDVVGYWTGIELLIMNEIARRYYNNREIELAEQICKGREWKCLKLNKRYMILPKNN